MGVLDNTLEARVQALEAELATMRRPGGSRSRPAPPHAGEERTSISDPPTCGPPVADRRGVVKLLAAGAVGAVAGAAINGQSAAAADNNPVLQGKENNATGVTTLTATDNTALYLWSDVYQGLESDGADGNALFTAGGDAPVKQAAYAGTLWVDKNGNWWAATDSDSQDGQWRKLAGPGTAGALHLLESPKRVYDSRPGESPAVDPKSPLTPNVARSIDPKANASGVPAEARGVLITLTIPALSAGGYATVWPGGPWPGTSNINFSPNQNIATTTVVGLGSDAKFLVQSNVSTNALIDIVGYYL